MTLGGRKPAVLNAKERCRELENRDLSVPLLSRLNTDERNMKQTEWKIHLDNSKGSFKSLYSVVVDCICHLELNLFNQTVLNHICIYHGRQSWGWTQGETLCGGEKKALTWSICITAMLYSWAQDSWRSLLKVLVPTKSNTFRSVRQVAV